MKVAFDWKFLNGGRIITRVLNNQRRDNRNKKYTKEDIIRLTLINSRKRKTIDCDITPEEAVYISNALLSAYRFAIIVQKSKKTVL